MDSCARRASPRQQMTRRLHQQPSIDVDGSQSYSVAILTNTIQRPSPEREG